MKMRQLINNNDYAGIQQMLSANPGLANEGIPYDADNTAKAHPLHRICDAVFEGRYTDAQAIGIAKLFLQFGADINGGALVHKRDTPLIAAASLHADQLAILYLSEGAAIHHAGTHGGTALHWAAWCGRKIVVERLVAAGAAIDQQCIDFTATPLFWAVHGLKRDPLNNLNDYLDCAAVLLRAGAATNIPNIEGKTVFDLLNEEDTALKELLHGG